MNTPRSIPVMPLLVLFLIALCATGMAVAQDAVGVVQVVDEDGQALLARVTVARVGTPTPEIHVFFTDPAGAVRLEGVPAGGVTVEATRGPEWSVESAEAQVLPGAEGVLTMSLRRLYDLRAMGYFQGDGHLHSTESDGAQPPAQVAYHARCEGLDWAILTDHETVSGHEAFHSQATENFLTIGGQEITTRNGHILGLGITDVVSRDVSQGAEDIRRIFREVNDQGGLSVLAHPMTPTMAYLHWDVDGYDVVEILNGSLPPHTGLFDIIQARLRWHQLLTDGARVAAIGTSDNHCNYSSMTTRALRDPEAAMRAEPRLRLLWNMPNRDEVLIPWALKGLHLGTYRTAVKIPELDEAQVLEAVRAGRSFITSGPILVVQVNETDPGSEIAGPTAHVRFEAVGNRGLERVEVRVDGEVVETVDLEGLERADGELTVDIEGAGWLVVECYGTWPDFATTNAWYVGAEG